MSKRYLIPLVLICCILAAGCLSGNELSGETHGSRAIFDSDDVAVQEKGAYQGMSAPAPAAASVPATAADGSFDQKLIQTGSISLEVGNVADSMATLKSIAEGRGGYLSSSNLYRGSSDRLSATVTVRVPGSAFDGTLSEIRTLGKILSESMNSQDVTEEYIDLTAQKEAKQHQLDQYNRIIEKAEKVEDVLKVQVEIERVQVDLDRLEGRLRYLDNRVDLATISVNLQEPAPIGGDAGHSFIKVINQGIEGFLFMVDALIILFFSVLPLIILGLLGFGIYRWRKQGKAAIIPQEKTAEAAQPEEENK
ncbi:MAG: hypothetical protein APR53_02370 [Methanoculleus sp. SDB]|nr:MAG: hypothetical protein APR53_02370 [Methanoculleus sp. SDB]